MADANTVPDPKDVHEVAEPDGSPTGEIEVTEPEPEPATPEPEGIIPVPEPDPPTYPWEK